MSQPIVVFGASGGLGSAIAQTLAGNGWPIVLAGRNASRLDALAAERGGAETLACDVTDPVAVAGAFADLAERHHTLSGVVVSIARPFRNRLTHRTDWSAYAEQIDSQLKALHLIATHAFPLLSGHDGTARLLVVSSEFVLGTPPVKTAPYSAAKAAMTTYAQVIAQEWLKHGIRVHILAPGMVQTDLIADMPQAFIEQVASTMPERRLTRAEDVADMAAFCFTDAADPLYGMPIRISRGAR